MYHKKFTWSIQNMTTVFYQKGQSCAIFSPHTQPIFYIVRITMKENLLKSNFHGFLKSIHTTIDDTLIWWYFLFANKFKLCLQQCTCDSSEQINKLHISYSATSFLFPSCSLIYLCRYGIELNWLWRI